MCFVYLHLTPINMRMHTGTHTLAHTQRNFISLITKGVQSFRGNTVLHCFCCLLGCSLISSFVLLKPTPPLARAGFLTQIFRFTRSSKDGAKKRPADPWKGGARRAHELMTKLTFHKVGFRKFLCSCEYKQSPSQCMCAFHIMDYKDPGVMSRWVNVSYRNAQDVPSLATEC